VPFIRKHWPVIFLFLIPLIPLWRAIFLGESIGPFDQIRQMAPWYGPKPSQPWDVLQADGVLQFYGWRDLVFQSWAHGTIPFWNPFELCGTPLLANSQSAPLYPGHILMGLLHIPTSIAVSLLAWFICLLQDGESQSYRSGWELAKRAEPLAAPRSRFLLLCWDGLDSQALSPPFVGFLGCYWASHAYSKVIHPDGPRFAAWYCLPLQRPL